MFLKKSTVVLSLSCGPKAMTTGNAISSLIADHGYVVKEVSVQNSTLLVRLDKEGQWQEVTMECPQAKPRELARFVEEFSAHLKTGWRLAFIDYPPDGTFSVTLERELDLTEAVAELTVVEQQLLPVLLRVIEKESFGLSLRAYNCIWNADCLVIGKLVQLSEAEFLKTKNCGKKTVNEVKEKILEPLGLSFGMKFSKALQREFEQVKQK